MLRARVDEGLERRFRELAMKRFGYMKDSISRAAEEAILNWISMVEGEDLEFEGYPVEVIDGILSDVKIDSVELQHKVKDIWLLRVVKNCI
ncbi:MAG: hypothetical protein NDF54_04570 [archaeon GB-1867-035]|nr:hypothetical protein [Candidatus Culexmicrobium profundum]